jgi:hypothetical protein
LRDFFSVLILRAIDLASRLHDGASENRRRFVSAPTSKAVSGCGGGGE